MQLTTFGNLHRCLKLFSYGIGKGLSTVATIDKQTTDFIEIGRTTIYRLQGSGPVCHVGGGHCKGMGQALCIHGNMALNPRHFLAGIVALVPGTGSVLDALRINDQEARLYAASLFGTGLANQIFLTPAPGRSRHPGQAHSIWQSTNAPSAIWETHWAAYATGSRS